MDGGNSGPPPADGGNTGDPHGSSDAGAGVYPGLALDSACSVLNGRRCGFLQRCGLAPAGGDAQRACAQYFTETSCGPSLWPARVKEGTLLYDGAQAQACAQAWDSHVCSDFAIEPEPCRRLHVPAAPLGGICLGGPARECKEGSCTGGTCPRRCRAPGTSGDVCERDGDCTTGLYCRRTATSGTVGTCAAYPTAGDNCDSFRPCGPGTYCGEFSLCASFRQAGESCVPGSCAPSTWCAMTADGGVCMEGADVDGPCSYDAQCASSLLCLKETGRCGSPGPLPQGAACTLRQTCAIGLTCVGTHNTQTPGVGTCLPPVPAAGPCTSTFDCEAHSACDPALDGGTCAERLDEGAPCRQDRDCNVFSRCHAGACTALPSPGEPCPQGACTHGTCGAADGGVMCTGMAGTGTPCTRNAECRSLQCVAGACLPACSP